MKIKGLIFFTLLVSTGFLNAQTNFKPGYIITISGDTLYGEIDSRGDLLMSIICKFKTADNTINEFAPQEILAYRFIDSRYYVSREINGTSFYLEFLIKGKVNVYYMRDDKGDHYYLNKDDEKLTELPPYEEGIKYVNNKQILYKSKKHLGILNYYMKDAPEIQSRIKSIERPDHNNLIKLAEEYHNAVCEGEKCIVYEKAQPFIKINPEFVGGVVNFEDVEDLKDRFYFQGGFIGHIWMPRTNENLYVRTGLLYSQLEIKGENSSFYKIPFHIEYFYPNGFIRPRLSYGLNFYYPSFQSVSLNFGTNIKLKESIFLSATSDIEFNSMMMVLPSDFLSFSINIGIMIEIN